MLKDKFSLEEANYFLDELGIILCKHNVDSCREKTYETCKECLLRNFKGQGWIKR